MSDTTIVKHHARLSPSASGRWLTCTGSVQLIERNKYQNTQTEHSATGTAAHDLLEAALLANEYDCSGFKGRVFNVGDYKITVDDDMIEAVNHCLHRVESLITDDSTEILTEQFITTDHLQVQGLEGGTADVVILGWDSTSDEEYLSSIHVIDYKNGMVRVDAENNSQLLIYMIGLLRKYYGAYDHKTRFTIEIVQPNAFRDPRPDYQDLTLAELEYWKDNVLIPIAKRTMTPAAKLVPSEKACHWCPAKADCLALNHKLDEALKGEGYDLPRPVDSLCYHDRAQIRKHQDVLIKYIKAVSSKFDDDILTGRETLSADGDFKVVKGKSKRTYTDDASDEWTTPLLDYLDHTDIYNTSLKCLTDVEKALKKKIGASQAKEVMSQITKKSEPVNKVVMSTDKRKKVEISAIEDFTDLKESI